MSRLSDIAEEDKFFNYYKRRFYFGQAPGPTSLTVAAGQVAILTPPALTLAETSKVSCLYKAELTTAANAWGMGTLYICRDAVTKDAAGESCNFNSGTPPLYATAMALWEEELAAGTYAITFEARAYGQTLALYWASAIIDISKS
jgi:hypothetical protein